MSFVSQAFYKTPIDTKDTYTNDELQPLEKVSINRWRLAMPEDGNQQHKGAHRPRFFFLHSREDTLLDVEYEQQALDFFAKSGVDLHVDLDTLRVSQLRSASHKHTRQGPDTVRTRATTMRPRTHRPSSLCCRKSSVRDHALLLEQSIRAASVVPQSS